MKIKLLFLFLCASVVGWGQTTDLFFSEYVEGSSSNKYVEIYNGTGASVDLSNYQVRLFANGDSTATATLTLSGSLANGATIVYKNTGATIYNGTAIAHNGITGFNGDDALGLWKISTSSYVDIFGRIGNDPGAAWTNTTPAYSTLDKTLRRKSTVCGGVTVNPSGTGAGAFTTLTTEWDIFNIDVVTGLGSHIANCSSCTAPTNQATSFTTSAINQTTATVEWARGNGDKVLVVARAGAAVNADPTSGTTYTANSAFGSGTQIGTGNYVVYNGTDTSVDLTGLTAGTTYHFAVYEYNDTDTCYNTTELTGNLTTLSAPSLSTSTDTLDFSQTCYGTSEEISFTISGTNLEAGEISLSSIPNYTYSETSGGPSITSFTHAAGDLSPKTIYVTHTPSAAGQNYSNNFIISSTSNTQEISIIVISNSYTGGNISTLPASNITTNSAILNGNISYLSECHNFIEKGFIYSKSSDTTTPQYEDVDGITVFKVAVSGLSLGSFSSLISSLEPDNEYTFTAFLYNGIEMHWSQYLTFTTLGNATQMVFNPAPPGNAAVNANLTTFRVEARRANNTIETNFSGPITISKASGPGNMNGTLTANAVAGIATFNDISFDDAGTYTIAANSGSFSTLTSGNIVVSYISSYTDFFRSKPGTGNWNSPSTWESSPNGLNGWINATVYPDEEAGGVLIPVGSTVNVSSSGIYITNTNVNGILRIATPGANPFTITGDTDYELIIENGGILDVSSEGYPSYASDSYILIKTGGKIIANPGIDTEYFLNDYLDYYGVMVFEHDAIAEWNVPAYPPSSNDLDWEIYNDDIIYPIDDTAVPIFRISDTSSNTTYAYGNFSNPNYINAILEINTSKVFNIQGSTTKNIMGGINGIGTVNVLNSSGDLTLGDVVIVPELGGNITLTIPSTDNRIKLVNGAFVPPTANFTIQGNDNVQNRTIQRLGGTLNVEGKLNITNLRIVNSASGGIVVNDGGILNTTHTEGLYGSLSAIQNGNLTLNTGSTIEYSALGNQTITTQLLGTLPNQYNYQNLLITGTGEKTTAPGDVIVNGMTSIKSASAKLRVPRPGNIPDLQPIPLSTTPNVFYALGGIDNTNGTTGEFILSSDANLLQHTATRNNADNTNASIKVERFVQDMDANLPATPNPIWDYVYWSSPVENHALRPFSPGTQSNRFYEYRESNNLFYNAPENVFIQGKGYAIRAEGNQGVTYDKTYNFTGKPFNDNSLLSPILKNEANGYNLVGNPYPSNIDLELLFSENSDNIHSIAYFWTNNTPTYYQSGANYVSNSYAIYNGSGGVPAAASSNPSSNYNVTAIPNGFAKVGQGFIVKAKTNNVSGVEFKTEMRKPTNDAFYQKVAKNRFWLSLTAPTEIVNTILIGYIPGATNGFDNDYDANLMTVGSDAIYSILENRKLAIQGKDSNFQNTDVIPIGVKIFQVGRYKIDIVQLEGLFENQKIYLKDKLRNVYHDFDNGFYLFKSEAGVYNDRFEIVFKRRYITASSTVKSVDNVIDKITITKENKNIVITSSDAKITEVEIFNLSGKSIYQNKTVNKTQLQIPNSSFDKEIIIVTVETENGEKVSKKLINN